MRGGFFFVSYSYKKKDEKKNNYLEVGKMHKLFFFKKKIKKEKNIKIT
jgi:hypothetical protein